MVKTLPFSADSMGSILGQATKIPHDAWWKKKTTSHNHNIKQKQYCIMDHDGNFQGDKSICKGMLFSLKRKRKYEAGYNMEGL